MIRELALDYFTLKEIVDPLVAEIDHSFLCDRSDKLIADFLKASGLKVAYVDFPTTAENIAKWFFERLATLFIPMKHLRELRVRIQETERTYAEVLGPINV